MPAYVGTILLARDEGLFLNVTPILRKKRLIIEVSALTPRLGRKAIAKSLKRDVGLLGPRGFAENHGAASAWTPGGRQNADRLSRADPSSTRSSHLIATDSLIA